MMKIRENTTKPKLLRPWSSPWEAPLMMLLGMMVGVGFGLGHHEYYRSFDNSVVQSSDQQQWILRIGTGFAFLTKTAFTATVGVAFTQYLWVIARKKPLLLQNLDAMFSMTSSPLSFLDVRMLASAKILAIIGLISWFLPLIATVTPATLTVESRLTGNKTSELAPYPNFSSPAEARGNIWSDFQGTGFINSASPALTRLLGAVSSGMAILPVAAPYPNSSYSMQFHGPCWKCMYLQDAVHSPDYAHLGNTSETKNRSLSQVWSDFNSLKRGDYYNGTMLSGTNIFLAATGPTNITDNTGGRNITCQLRNASYTVDFNFDQGTPSTTITKLDLEPVLEYNSYVSFIKLPVDTARAYLSMHLALGELLQGSIRVTNGLSSSGMAGGDTPFVKTGLLACPEIIDSWKSGIAAGSRSSVSPLNETTAPWMCRRNSLLTAIEDLSHNFTLSMLSSASFSTLRPVDVHLSFPLNYYAYHPRTLAIAYLAGLGATLACCLVGTWACRKNESSGNASFSTILHATRNPQLDYLARADALGRDGGKSPWTKTKLQYGIIDQPGEARRAAFGTPDSLAFTERGYDLDTLEGNSTNVSLLR